MHVDAQQLRHRKISFNSMFTFKNSATCRSAITISISVLVMLTGYCQSLRYPIASRYAGMGAYSVNFVDPLSVLSNQAALANVEGISAGIYAEKRFLLEELSVYNLSFCFPLFSGGIGLSTRYFGYNGFNETQIGIGYGKALGKIDIGMQVNLHSLKIPDYGNDIRLNFEAGAILHISEQVYAGIHVYNPAGSKFGKDNLEKLSSTYSGGLGYEASEKLFVSAEIIKEEDKPVNINAGMQYVIDKKIFFRVGLYTETTNLYIGVGLRWNDFRVDVTASYHPQLGLTPGVLIVFKAKRKEE